MFDFNVNDEIFDFWFQYKWIRKIRKKCSETGYWDITFFIVFFNPSSKAGEHLFSRLRLSRGFPCPVCPFFRLICMAFPSFFHTRLPQVTLSTGFLKTNPLSFWCKPHLFCSNLWSLHLTEFGKKARFFNTYLRKLNKEALPHIASDNWSVKDLRRRLVHHCIIVFHKVKNYKYYDNNGIFLDNYIVFVWLARVWIFLTKNETNKMSFHSVSQEWSVLVQKLIFVSFYLSNMCLNLIALKRSLSVKQSQVHK